MESNTGPLQRDRGFESTREGSWSKTMTPLKLAISTGKLQVGSFTDTFTRSQSPTSQHATCDVLPKLAIRRCSPRSLLLLELSGTVPQSADLASRCQSRSRTAGQRTRCQRLAAVKSSVRRLKAEGHRSSLNYSQDMILVATRPRGCCMTTYHR